MTVAVRLDAARAANGGRNRPSAMPGDPLSAALTPPLASTLPLAPTWPAAPLLGTPFDDPLPRAIERSSNAHCGTASAAARICAATNIDVNYSDHRAQLKCSAAQALRGRKSRESPDHAASTRSDGSAQYHDGTARRIRGTGRHQPRRSARRWQLAVATRTPAGAGRTLEPAAAWDTQA